MRKRVVSWTLLALLVLSCATFGTARARQVAGVNVAQSRLALARVGTARALATAAHDGMSANELAPYRQQRDALARVPRPHTMPLWDPTSAGFFDRQSVAYRRLTTAIRLGQVRATAHAKVLAAASLDDLSRDIATAGSLDLDVSGAQKALNTERAALTTGTTISSFRSIITFVGSSRAALKGPTQDRLAYVRSVTTKAGGTLAGVTALADAETQNARNSLPLLGLLTSRVHGYDADLTRLDGTVHAQKSAFAAAVKEGPLHDEVARIARDYAQTIPSKMIVVSTENQHADMYEGSNIVYSTDVTTGGPELPTDHGVFHIYFKASPFVFHSPWPVGSPYYYNPTPVQFWMPFDGGEGLHDASWRSNFGPGSNVAPTDLGTGNTILGTHGCVNLPFAAAQFVWDWAPVGTTVVVT